jgi:hypothetical protein
MSFLSQDGTTKTARALRFYHAAREAFQKEMIKGRKERTTGIRKDFKGLLSGLAFAFQLAQHP